jgi:DNA adenine methylase
MPLYDDDIILLGDGTAHKAKTCMGHTALRPFRWLGGKSESLKIIYEHLHSHITFVDIFGGSGTVTLSKGKSPVEVYNDANRDLVNFMRVVRDKNKFRELISMLPEKIEIKDIIAVAHHYNKEIKIISKKIKIIDEKTKKITNGLELSARFANTVTRKKLDYLEIPEHEGLLGTTEYVDSVKMAYAFFVMQSTAPGDRGAHYNSTCAVRYLKKKCNALKRKTIINKLTAMHERLQNVMILNTSDFIKIIQEFDSASTVFYVDPPYIPSSRVMAKTGDYQHEMTRRDHLALLNELRNIKGRAIVSGYISDEYGILEEGDLYKYYSHKIGKKIIKTESLWVK